jgi:hypothetical protein
LETGKLKSRPMYENNPIKLKDSMLSLMQEVVFVFFQKLINTSNTRFIDKIKGRPRPNV